jgi:hypothetical protein
VYVCVCIQFSVEKLGGAEKIDEAELVIECWDYDFVSNDDLIGRSVFVRGGGGGGGREREGGGGFVCVCVCEREKA